MRLVYKGTSGAVDEILKAMLKDCLTDERQGALFGFCFTSYWFAYIFFVSQNHVRSVGEMKLRAY